MAKVHGFEYVILRPHNVFGERQNMKDPYRNVVTIFMNSLLIGDPLPIYGDGEQVRQLSYIDGVVKQIMERPQVRGMLGVQKNTLSTNLPTLLRRYQGYPQEKIPTRTYGSKRAGGTTRLQDRRKLLRNVSQKTGVGRKNGPSKAYLYRA